jgi:ribonuclease BN (tRNA processing enzyme)
MTNDTCILLGSGGWMPTNERETAALYLRRGDHVLLVDAGTGLHRLVQQPELLQGAERVDIVLTHFHLDHVIGLSYLPGLALTAKPFVWGPGKALYDAPTRDFLARLVNAPLFATGIEEMTTEVADIEGDSLRLPSFEIRSRRQDRHPHPTLALRVEDVLSYCTDTAYDPGNVAFAKESELLLHEAWYSHDGDDPSHSSAGQAAAIARQADVGRLVLIHVNPLGGSTEELVRAAQEVFPSAEVGSDLAFL